MKTGRNYSRILQGGVADGTAEGGVRRGLVGVVTSVGCVARSRYTIGQSVIREPA